MEIKSASSSFLDRLKAQTNSNLSLPLFVVNTITGDIVFASADFLNMLGTDASSQLILKSFIAADDFNRLSVLANETATTGVKTFAECHIITANGPLYVQFRCFAVPSEENVVVCTVNNASENELLRSYHEICRSNFASVSETVSGGMFKFDWCNGAIVYVDRAVTSYDYSGFSGGDPNVHGQIRSNWLEQLRKHIEDGEKQFSLETQYTRPSGNISAIRFDIYLLREFGNHKNYICFYEETDEIKRNLRKLSALKTRFQLLLENSLDAVFEYSYTTEKLTYINSDTYSGSAHKSSSIVKFKDFFYEHEDVFTCNRAIADDFFNGKAVAGEEFRITRGKEGEPTTQWFVLKSRVIADENGKPLEAIGTLHDVTSEKITQLQLEEKMKSDSLTGFLNFKSFCTECRQKIPELLFSNVNYAVVTFKINNITDLNEQLGVLFGDTVIKNLSAKIKTSFTNDAVLGRISGSSFSVLVYGFYDKAAVLQAVENVYDNFCRIFADVNENSQALLKIGVAFSLDSSDEIETLLFKSKIAITAQENSNKKYECFEQSMESLCCNSVTEPENALDAYRITMDDMTSEMCMMLISTPDTDAAITACLAFLGEHYGISRAYIYERVGNSDYVSCSYEWCSDKVEPYKKEMQSLKIENVEKFTKIYADDIVVVNNLDAISDVLPFAVKAIEKLSPKMTALQFPIRQNGLVCGFIGFDRYDSYYVWSNQEKTKLMTLCGFISNQVAKLRLQTNRISEHNLFGSVISHMNLDVYSINPKNYELLYTNFAGKSVKSDYDNAKCYEVLKNRNCPCNNCPILGLPADRNSSYSMRVFDEKKKSWMDVTAFPTLDYYGRESVAIAWHDITNYGQLLADTDELTASPMFNMFMPKVEIITSQYPDDEFAMLYLNCKKLRIINESYSYATGNKMLIAVSKTIADYLTPKETYARISADKFVIFKERKNLGECFDDYLKLLERFRYRVFKRLNESVSLASINFNVGVYIPTDNYVSVSDMLDKSCIAAKVADGLDKHSNVFLYNQDLLKSEERIAFIESRMQEALDNDEFKLYLQPKFNLKTGELSGAEALSRWLMADGQFMMPGDFIPIFEKNGFITKLDFHVYESVLKRLRYWIDSGNKPILVSVNVSRAHINDVLFADKLLTLLEKYHIKPSMLELELTETMFVDNSEQMIDFIENLHNLGFVISIDDFGSGYSSLNLLKDMSIDVVKIDKSMFGNGSNAKEKPLLEGVVSMAKRMNMETICEGVETEKQVEFLREIECDFAQGFLYQRPLPLEIFEQKYTKISDIVQ